jgi:hypothetical protein
MIGYSETESLVFPFKTLIDAKIIQRRWRMNDVYGWSNDGRILARHSRNNRAKKEKIGLNTTLSTVNSIRTGLVSNMDQFALGN